MDRNDEYTWRDHRISEAAKLDKWMASAQATARQRSYCYPITPAPSQHWLARAMRAVTRWL